MKYHALLCFTIINLSYGMDLPFGSQSNVTHAESSSAIIAKQDKGKGKCPTDDPRYFSYDELLGSVLAIQDKAKTSSIDYENARNTLDNMHASVQTSYDKEYEALQDIALDRACKPGSDQLLYAILAGEEELIDRLIDDPHQFVHDSLGNTPLHHIAHIIACQESFICSVKRSTPMLNIPTHFLTRLANKYPDALQAKNNRGETPYSILESSCAAWKGNLAARREHYPFAFEQLELCRKKEPTDEDPRAKRTRYAQEILTRIMKDH